MQRLIINDNNTDIFVNDDTLFIEIVKWVENQVYNEETNIFNLNERFSCIVEYSVVDNFIKISGDEDLKIITFEKVVPII